MPPEDEQTGPGGAQDWADLRARKIPTEAMVSVLVHRMNDARTAVTRPGRVAEWSEIIEAIMDLITPVIPRDDAFWKAWDDRPVATVRTPSGKTVPLPTASDCRHAEQLLLSALARNGMLYNASRVSGPGLDEARREGLLA